MRHNVPIFTHAVVRDEIALPAFSTGNQQMQKKNPYSLLSAGTGQAKLCLTAYQQLTVAGVLLSFLITTRGHHVASMESLPAASWAVFFLAGIYLRPGWVLPAMLVLVWAIDFTPYLFVGDRLINLYEGRIFCLTPAYIWLLPAYTALWLAGRWYVHRHNFRWRTLLRLGTAVVVGAGICQLFSSGGFYFFSGRFSDPSASELLQRLWQYHPVYLRSLAFYVVLSACVHGIVGAVYQPADKMVDSR